jgi:hypothetical protein
MKQLSNERSFDRGAWWLLAGVSLFVLLVLWNTVAVLRLPGDGWQIDYNDRDQGTHRLIYFMGDWPTPLQVDDVVTAVNSHPLPSAVQMAPEILPVDWQDGETIQYTIQRQGETMTVPVMLHYLTTTDILRGLANAAGDELPQWGWFFVGFVLFFLRPNNRAARLLLVAGCSFAVIAKLGGAAITISLDFAPPLTWLSNWIANFFWGWLFFPSLILLLLSFPLSLWPLTRFPRLVPALFYGIPLGITAYTLITGDPNLATALLFLEAALILGTAVAAIVQVYRHKQDRVIRAQVSWVALGIGITMGGTLVAYLLEYTGVVTANTLNSPLTVIISWPVALALPICMAIAILRYRLFDINVIIRKTLVYTLLSMLLALVYFGSVVLLQTIFESVVQERSPFIIVVSTLLIAALFAPLRRRVQRFIDRRFYRRKYDAQQILAQFAQIARDEVSLEVLTGELTRAVQETMEPEQISVWMKPITRKS